MEVLIPHVLDEEDTTIWEDIYLYPDADDWAGSAYMLTIDAVDRTTFEDHGMTRAELDDLLAGPLCNHDFFIDGATLTLHASEFSRADVLRLAKVWLDHLGHECDALIEAPYDEMAKWAVSHHFPGDETKDK